MMSEICGPDRWARFEEHGDRDFAYEMDEHSRFRCNFLEQSHGYGCSLPTHPHSKSCPSISSEFPR